MPCLKAIIIHVSVCLLTMKVSHNEGMGISAIIVKNILVRKSLFVNKGFRGKEKSSVQEKFRRIRIKKRNEVLLLLVFLLWIFP